MPQNVTQIDGWTQHRPLKLETPAWIGLFFFNLLFLGCILIYYICWWALYYQCRCICIQIYPRQSSSGFNISNYRPCPTLMLNYLMDSFNPLHAVLGIFVIFSAFFVIKAYSGNKIMLQSQIPSLYNTYILHYAHMCSRTFNHIYHCRKPR